jgi:hypothetical protein
MIPVSWFAVVLLFFGGIGLLCSIASASPSGVVTSLLLLAVGIVAYRAWKPTR